MAGNFVVVRRGPGRKSKKKTTARIAPRRRRPASSGNAAISPW
jgi:hypothetical protein